MSWPTWTKILLRVKDKKSFTPGETHWVPWSWLCWWYLVHGSNELHILFSLLIPHLAVSPGSRAECNNNRRLELREPQGTIASVTSQNYGLGSSRCPWVIKAKPGQKINVTMVDFGLSGRNKGKYKMYMKNLHLQADLFMGASAAST